MKGVKGCDRCDEEAVTTFKSLKQKFNPGKQAGKTVNVWYTLSIVLEFQ